MFSTNSAADATLSAKGGLGSSPGGSGGSGMGSSLAQLFGGLFGNGGSSFEDAMKEFQKYMQQGIGGLQPYNQAGQGAINPFQQRLGQMSDPTAFYKQMMSGYGASPLAQNQQREGMQAATNMGSATGMAGSTPMMQAAQQNAQNISSGDMQNYYNNMSGINQNYMSGLSGLMGNGLSAAGSQGNLYQQLAQMMGGGAYGANEGKQQDFSSILSGLFGAGGKFFGF